MDDDDPERRIAELESRLGDHVTLTPQDVHDLAFSSARGGRRGYHEHEVDAFLDRIEATLRDPTATGGLTAADLRAVAFSKPPLGRRGYNEDEVDAFISRVEAQLARRPGGPSPVDSAASSGRDSKRSKQSAAETIANQVFAFGAELFAHHPVVTWRAPLALGLLMILLGFISHPAFFVVAGFLLLWAAIEWRSR